MEAALGKPDIRDLARLLGIPNHQKPASPCLASRVPHGTPVSAEVLARVEAGEADAVVGVRAERQDTFVRRASSKVGNAVRNFLTGDKVKDAACGIKVIRRSYFLRVPRFVGMHRFMATLVRYLGGAVVEQDVNHRERYAGTAKYGIGNRMWKGLRDCFAMRWVRQRLLMHEVKEEY